MHVLKDKGLQGAWLQQAAQYQPFGTHYLILGAQGTQTVHVITPDEATGPWRGSIGNAEYAAKVSPSAVSHSREASCRKVSHL